MLHVGNDEVAAQRSYPKFEVTLPEGRNWEITSLYQLISEGIGIRVKQVPV